MIVGGHPAPRSGAGCVLRGSALRCPQRDVRWSRRSAARPTPWWSRRAPRPTPTASEEVFAILESVTPLVEPLSLDEAFLDVTDSQSLFGTPARSPATCAARIARELHLPASAGIAAVKFVAKVASRSGQAQRTVRGRRRRHGELPGASAGRVVCGAWAPKTEAPLLALGIRTIGELAARDPAWLEERVSGGRACGS